MRVVVIVFVLTLVVIWRFAKRNQARSPSVHKAIRDRQLTWTPGMAAAIQDYGRQIAALGEPDKRSMAKQIGRAMAEEWDDGWYISAWARNQSSVSQEEIVRFGRQFFDNPSLTDAEVTKEVFAMCVAFAVYGYRIPIFDLPQSELHWYLG